MKAFFHKFDEKGIVISERIFAIFARIFSVFARILKSIYN